MGNDLQKLVEASRSLTLTDDQKESQRRSFAYGNIHIENRFVTRTTIDQEAESLKAK